MTGIQTQREMTRDELIQKICDLRAKLKSLKAIADSGMRFRQAWMQVPLKLMHDEAQQEVMCMSPKDKTYLDDRAKDVLASTTPLDSSEADAKRTEADNEAIRLAEIVQGLLLYDPIANENDEQRAWELSKAILARSGEGAKQDEVTLAKMKRDKEFVDVVNALLPKRKPSHDSTQD